MSVQEPFWVGANAQLSAKTILKQNVPEGIDKTVFLLFHLYR
jgi:hypothetical protein